MRFTRVRLVMATAIVLGLATAAAVVASGASDFGLKQEHRLNAQANQLFGGIGKPLGATAAQASGTEGAGLGGRAGLSHPARSQHPHHLDTSRRPIRHRPSP
jgi:hypothetical protein